LGMADLTQASLAGANLSGSFLSRTNLNKACLIKANLAGADITFTNFLEAELIATDMTGNIFNDSNNISDSQRKEMIFREYDKEKEARKFSKLKKTSIEHEVINQ